jgi:hypothetical protein
MKTKLALMLASVILIGSLAVNVYLLAQLCTLTISSNDAQKEVDALKTQTANLKKEKMNLQKTLETKQSKAEPPNLVTRLGAKDVRASPYANHPWSGRIRLYVSGEVWNVGRVPAYNCRLHVILYQGDTKANDTYVILGTINPGAFVDVAANVNYDGEALTNWAVTTEIG